MPVSRKRRKGRSGKKKKNRNKELWKQRPTSDFNKRLFKKVQTSELLKGAKVEMGSFDVKVSELILDYGSDLIAFCKTKSDYEKFIPLLILCWNIGTLPPEKREEGIETITKDFKEIEEDVRYLVDRKVRFYGEYEYLVAEYEIKMLKDGIHLSVASVKLE